MRFVILMTSLLLAVPAQAWETDSMSTFGDGTSYGSSTTYPQNTYPGFQPLQPLDPITPPVVIVQPQPMPDFSDAFRTRPSTQPGIRWR